MKKVLSLGLILIVITGCYNYQEINSLAVVSSMVIDFEDEEFRVMIEIGELGEDRSTTSLFLDGSGSSLGASIRGINQRNNQILYFANLEVLLLSERAFDQLEEIINFINQDMHFAFNFNVVISSDFDEVFSLTEETDDITGVFIRELLQNRINERYNITYLMFLTNYLRYNRIILPLMEATDDGLAFTLVEVRND